MSETFKPAALGGDWSLPAWVPAALLLVGTAVVGPSLGGLSRPAFVIGCGAVGWLAWRKSPGAHLQAVLFLFAFAPFVRRIVDMSIGYDGSSIMLVGPLLAIMVPAVKLFDLLDSPRPLMSRLGPLVLVGACVVYATVISLLQGDMMNAISGALKWIAPLIYAAVLIGEADEDEMLKAATSAFLIILPIMGVYGILQYVDPPEWDRYWMQFASITSAGLPIPYGVRTFSTMNGPASFATFTAAGLLLIGFLRSNRLSILLVAPAVIAFCLSLYRTAWLSLIVGILFCILFSATRRRAVTIMVVLVLAVVAVVTLSPFADIISDRIGTLMRGSQDDSAQERLEQYVMLWDRWDSSLFGNGFVVTDVGVAGAIAIDGMIISSWMSMGIVVGLLCLFGLIWAASNAISVAWRDGRQNAIVIGAFACGALVQLPLANIASGELGFLFWTFVSLALIRRDQASPARG